MFARSIEIPGKPEAVLGAWQADRALAALWSGGAPDEKPGRWSRWTILAEPRGCLRVRARGGGGYAVEGCRLEVTDHDFGGARDVAAELDRCLAGTAIARNSRARDEPPFVGGWIGYLGYGLGRLLEPVAGIESPTRDDRSWPDLVLHRCPAAYVYDNLLGRWWVVGEEREAARLAKVCLNGDRPKREGRGYRMGSMRSETGREGYERAVAGALEYIRGGDIYQANLSHRLSGEFSGCVRDFFGAFMGAVGPWYGGYIETPDRSETRHVMVSASPELFLEVEGCSGRVVTRPMKGTRPVGAGARALRDSAKDRAELAMIIDLMRNDLGRVCRFGSVRVEEERVIERHGGSVWQGVASVSGVLRDGAGLGDLLRATFPGGSVTGAPKIRAMQIIEELEPVARGPYCGAFGYISDCGNAALAMSIRTALIGGRPGGGAAQDEIVDGVLDYSVGAGIVADSHPRLEWEETMAKAAILEMVRPAQGAAR